MVSCRSEFYSPNFLTCEGASARHAFTDEVIYFITDAGLAIDLDQPSSPQTSPKARPLAQDDHGFRAHHHMAGAVEEGGLVRL